MKVYPYEAIDIGTEATGTFKVNGSRLKHYFVGEPIDEKVSYNLLDATSSYHSFTVKLMPIKERFSRGTSDHLLSG